MPKNRMTDLRDHLFETLERLKDEENPMEVDVANAIVGVAGALIETAKVEVAFLKATDAVVEGHFFDSPLNEPRAVKRIA